MAPVSNRAERSEATRRTLLKVARRLFARRGYANTSIEEIVRGTKLTRGALYHHFDGKHDLFRAVFEELQHELTQRIGKSVVAEPDPLKRLSVGLDAFLDACLDRDVREIVLLDGPSVLGQETWHEIDARHALGMTTAALQAAMDAGYIRRVPIEPLGHLVLGALHQGGLYIARAADMERARREIGEALSTLIDGWRTGEPA